MGVQTPSPEQIQEDLEEILRELGYLAPQRTGGSGSMRLLLYLLEVMAVVLLLFIVLYALFYTFNRYHSREKPSPKEKERGEEAEMLEKRDYTSLYRRAISLAKKAEYTEAVRVLYTALLILLDARKIVGYDPSLTNFEYRMRMRPHPLSPLFEKVTRAFDTIVYGGKKAADTDFSLFEETFTRMEEGLS